MDLLRVPRRDVVTAAVVTAASIVPLLVPLRQPWWVLALAFLSAAPVLWRRRLLVTSGAASGAAMTVLVLQQHTLPDPPFFFMPFGPLVCAYTFGAATPSKWQIVGGAGLAGGVILSVVLPHEDFDTSRYVVTAFVAAYALGMSARARRAQREVLEERAMRLEEERAAAAAEERTRIARDMHDIVTHSVGLMVVQAEAGPLALRKDQAKAEAAFEAIADTGREAIGQLRAILGALRGTSPREPQPGLGALPALVERSRRVGLDVTVEERGPRPAVSAAVDIAAYRIVQECLTNVLRHAAARTVRVSLAWSPRALSVEVADDGGGTADLREGNGIVGMRERVASCGGTLTVDPRGFTVTATLPLDGR
ncbi:sensor histidine kinase [Sphaerisporangium fuscum]|uniref:sensor histidine kinase n=1 Tax=Sphaerisporangium fuscum TaxID=2835868 RepID=UPI001BDBF4C0|nr:histidine kinase [Sphaerisporangium fuscum]